MAFSSLGIAVVDKESDKEKEPREADSEHSEESEDASQSADSEEPDEEVLKNLFADFRATKEIEKPSLDESKDDATDSAEDESVVDDSGDEAVEESEEEPGEQENFEPPREVAKTLLETDVSSVMEKARQLEEDESSQDQGQGDAKRVAKTLLESESPDLEKIKAMAEEHARDEADSERKVAKTMLESELPDMSALEKMSDSAEADEAEVTEAKVDRSTRIQEKVLEAAREIDEAQSRLSQEISNRPISRSLTDIHVSFSLESEQEKAAAAAAAAKSKESFVAKTMLDHELILDKLAESMERIEAKTLKEIEEKEKELASQPLKEIIPIDKYEKASPCQWAWEDDGYYDHFRYCGMCKQIVYNFDGMDKPEAMAIIFQRENRKDAPLFKRADGKFMTSDCPVALKKKRFLTLTAVTVGTIFTFLLLLGLLIPKEDPAPALNPSDQEVKTEFKGGGGAPQANGSGGNAAGADTSGEVFYDVNKPLEKQLPAQNSPQPVQKGPDYSSSPESDESGDFWSFPNGKPKSFDEPPVGSSNKQIYPSQPQKPHAAPAQTAAPGPGATKESAPSSVPARHPTVKTY